MMPLRGAKEKGEKTMKREKKTRRFRFNVIDAIVLVTVLAVFATLFIRDRLADNMAGTGSSDTVEIVFYVNDIRSDSAQAAVVGEKIFWKQNNMLIGTISDAVISPAEIYVEASDGTTKFGLNEERCDLRITVRATGAVTSEGFMLDGTQFIAAGKEMILLSRTTEVEGMVMSVREVG